MTQFFICRHGQSEYNAQKRLQGQIDTPLTDAGVQNARFVAQKLKDVNVRTIISSDLGRAFLTAYIIARELNFTDEIVREPLLREINFGDLAGLKIAEAEAKNPGLQSELSFTPPNGESLADVQNRVVTLFEKIAPRTYESPILLITHDVMINAISSQFYKLDFGEYNKIHYNPHDFVAGFDLENNEIVDFKEI